MIILDLHSKQSRLTPMSYDRVESMPDTFITIKYPGTNADGMPAPDLAHEEMIPARWLDGERYRLTQHSLFIPLAPGDIVTADAGVLTGVESMTDLYMAEVTFKSSVIEEDFLPVVLAQTMWEQEVAITKATNISLIISTPLPNWVEMHVISHPDVDWVELLRVPGETIDLRAEIRKH